MVWHGAAGVHDRWGGRFQVKREVEFRGVVYEKKSNPRVALSKLIVVHGVEDAADVAHRHIHRPSEARPRDARATAGERRVPRQAGRPCKVRPVIPSRPAAAGKN